MSHPFDRAVGSLKSHIDMLRDSLGFVDEDHDNLVADLRAAIRFLEAGKGVDMDNAIIALNDVSEQSEFRDATDDFKRGINDAYCLVAALPDKEGGK